MKAKILSISAVFLLTLVIAACKKNNSGPKIELKLKSVNGTSFPRNSRVTFKFDFTPKNPASDTLFVVRKFSTCPYNTGNDTLKVPFPEFSNKTQGELTYNFDYSDQGGVFYYGCFNGISARQTDSVRFTFWVKDKDGNVSDTVRPSKITLLK